MQVGEWAWRRITAPKVQEGAYMGYVWGLHARVEIKVRGSCNSITIQNNPVLIFAILVQVLKSNKIINEIKNFVIIKLKRKKNFSQKQPKKNNFFFFPTCSNCYFIVAVMKWIYSNKTIISYGVYNKRKFEPETFGLPVPLLFVNACTSVYISIYEYVSHLWVRVSISIFRGIFSQFSSLV